MLITWEEVPTARVFGARGGFDLARMAAFARVFRNDMCILSI